MATKKTTTPAPIAPFTIEQGALLYTFPATYVPDARRQTFADNDYKTLTKGRDMLRTADALDQAADIGEAEPDLFPFPAEYSPARLRQLAINLRAVAKARADLEAALTELGLYTQLDRDAAADATNDLLDLLKAHARRNATLKDRFTLLFNLNKPA